MHWSITESCLSNSLQCSWYLSPTGVRETRRVVLFMSRTPRCCSSNATLRVTTELETSNCFAASVKFRHSATFAKIRIAAIWFIEDQKGRLAYMGRDCDQNSPERGFVAERL